MMLAVAGPLAVVKFPGIEETGQGIFVFLGVFSVFEGSDFYHLLHSWYWAFTLVRG